MTYQSLSAFGSMLSKLPIYADDPLSSCLGMNINIPFDHGSNSTIYGQNSKPCQLYLAQRCANKWDEVCDFASSACVNYDRVNIPSIMGCISSNRPLTAADVLLYNTAITKYGKPRCGADCERIRYPFNPLNPHSPMISEWLGSGCSMIYDIDINDIDKDIVLHKLLDKPEIGYPILCGLKHTLSKKGLLSDLKGSRLGNYYGV